MALNTPKTNHSNSAGTGSGQGSLFTFLERVLNLEALVQSGLPERYLFRVLFVILLVLLYIGNTHTAERHIHKIEKLKQEVEDLRADYTTLKADIVYGSKQSEIARRVAPIGLEESKVPPTKIERSSEDEY
jgi:hypothetical protein